MASAATSWPELLSGPVLTQHRSNLNVIAGLAAQAVQLGSPVMMIGAYANAVSAVAIADGPGAVLPSFEKVRSPVLASIPRAMPDASNPLPAVSFLSFVHALEASGLAGVAVAALKPEALLGAVARGRKGLSERELHTAAFAAAGTAHTALVPKLLGHPALKEFEPGQAFGFNSVGFLEYLTRALELGAAQEDVRPGFEEFVLSFPRKLGAETLDWADLLWVGRAYLHALGKRPINEVAALLHDHVRALR